MKTYLLCVTLCAGICLALAGNTAAQSVNSDFWAATDALGRKVREYGETGERKKDKFVAMFYWTWHIYDMPPGSQVNNTTEILREHPEAIRSFDDPAWNNPGRYYWEQPLFGYYKTTDPWVLRKHAEMLADAGIDVVFFDCTNLTLTWKESYDVLMEVWSEALKDGVKAPKIAFMLPFGSPEYGGPQLHMLYEDIYKPGRHRELWFVWKGKPCIMARPEDLGDTPEDREIADFFTFRPGQPDYVNGPQRKDNWGWLELYPQNGYAPLPEGGYERSAVRWPKTPVSPAEAVFALSTGGNFRNFSMLKDSTRAWTAICTDGISRSSGTARLSSTRNWCSSPDGTNTSPAESPIGRPTGLIIWDSPISTTGIAAAISSRTPDGATKETYITCNWSTTSENSRG